MNSSEEYEGKNALEMTLSLERFKNYLDSCDGDRTRALELYELNTAVSATLYTPIQFLEISIRNRFHSALSLAYGEWWFDRGGVIINAFQRLKIADAQLELVKNKKPLTPGRVVASLTFGFWTAFLSAQYEDTLWRKGGLSKAFMASGEKPKRREVNKILGPIRLLRNRIAHHEPVLYYDLPKHHENILRLTEWLCPDTAEWSRKQSGFNSIYDANFAKRFLSPKQRKQNDSNQN